MSQQTPTTEPTTASTANPPSTRPETGAEQTEAATRVFSRSVVISGIRCTLAYVIFPWILPIVGVSDSVGPWIGIVISVVAVAFNIASIRRFWASRHRWRWAITAINLSVIVLLIILFVRDVSELT